MTKENVYLKYLPVILLSVLCSCKSQKTESESQSSTPRNSSDAVIKNDNLSYIFATKVRVINDNGGMIELVNLDNGCLIRFDYENSLIANLCDKKVISGSLPIYEIFRLDSEFVYTYGFEDQLVTEIDYPNSKKDTAFHEYYLEDANNRVLLLTKSDFFSINPEIFSYNLDEQDLKRLEISGDPFFGSTSEELFVAEMDEKGNTTVYKYWLPGKKRKELFDFEGDLYLFGYNPSLNILYFLGNNKQFIFEYRLNSKKLNLLVKRSDVQSPVYFEKGNKICFLTDEEKKLVIYKIP